jgi:hypothetical protein
VIMDNRGMYVLHYYCTTIRVGAVKARTNSHDG